MADCTAMATESFNYWMTNCNEAQKAAGLAELERFTNDEAFQ